jgi:hypothetical protein
MTHIDCTHRSKTLSLYVLVACQFCMALADNGWLGVLLVAQEFHWLV